MDHEDAGPLYLTTEQVLKAFERVNPYLQPEDSEDHNLTPLEEALAEERHKNQELRLELENLTSTS